MEDQLLNATMSTTDAMEQVGVPTPKPTIGDSLRELAQWYDEHPEIKSPHVSIYLDSASTKEASLSRLGVVAKAFGSCTKDMSEWNVTLERRFGTLSVRAVMDRAAVCTKRVVWDCPESLLAALGGEQEVAGALAGEEGN